MKTKSFLILCILIMRLSAMSQVKIGDNATTINSNSLLELETTNKGFVLPRVSITDVSAPAPLGAGLLTGTVVYNTNSGTTGGSGVGIYYWDGSQWNFIANTTITGNYWSLTGNSGTNASSNFIGTIDAIDFVARTNNMERMRILGANSGSSKAGWIGMGITLPRSSLDVTGDFTNKNVLTLQNTSSTGFTSVDMLDNTGTLKGTFGYANVGTGGSFGGRAYFNSYGSDLLFTANSGTYHLFLKGGTGYIGINTNAPSERLHVVGNFYLTGAFMPGGLAGTSGYVLTSAGANTAPTWNNLNSLSWNLTGNSGTSYVNNFLGTTDNVSMRFRTNNVQRMIIDSLGRVGIGLNNPSYALSVLSASNPLYLSGVQATSTFSADSILTINGGVVKKTPYSSLTGNFWSLTGNAGTNSAINFLGTTDNHPLKFQVNNSLGGYIDSSGGSGNTFFGYTAGSSTTTGTKNTAIGTQALNATTTGGTNVAVGYQSLRLNVSGTDNTSVGYQALQNSTGIQQTALGAYALQSYTSSANDNNTAVGYKSLQLNQTGTFNTAVGFQALQNNTAGGNTAVGTAALQANTTGTSNAAFGRNAALGNTTGTRNTAVGSSALVTNTIGTDQTAIGFNTLNASTGSSNTAVGSATLQVNSSGTNNTALGSSSLLTNTTGSSNTAIGTTALRNNISGSNNISIGNASGTTNTTGSNNITFGAQADVLSAGLTNAAAIGYNAKVALNNSLVLGDTTSGGNAVNVGIGVRNPLKRLHIDAAPVGSASTSDSLKIDHFASSNSAYNKAVMVIDSATGYVSRQSINTLAAGNYWSLTGNSGTNYTNNFLGTTDNVSLRFRTTNTEQMIIDSLGHVGIGSSSFNALNPAKLLVDYGTTTSNTIANFRGSIDDYFQINLQNKSSSIYSSTDYVATSDDGTDSTYYVDLGINSSTYNPSVDNFGGKHDAYLYASSRNLLIGTASANSDLIFLLGGGRSKYNTAMRMDGATGNIIIGTGDNNDNATGNIIRGPNGKGTNIAGGSLTLQGGSATGTATGGSLNLYGGSTVSGTTGTLNINANTNSATNINTGTSSSDVTIGNALNNINLPKLSATSVVLTDASKNLTSTTPLSNTYLYYNGSNFTWATATTLGSFSVTAPLTYNNLTGVFGITKANTTTDGYLSSTDWNTFNNKVGSITLNTPSSIFNNPINFSVSAGAATGTLSLNTQTANTVFAGPSSGIAATPTFRSLVAADIPSLSGLYIQNQTIVQASSNFNISGNGTIGTNLTVTGKSTLTGVTNTGTVATSGGDVTINVNSNNSTNINSGTSTSNVTIGNSNNNILFPKFNITGGIFYTSAATGQIANTGSGMTWDNTNSRLGIGLTNPSYKLAVLAASDPLYLSGVQATAAFTTDSVLTIYNGVVKKAPYSSLPSTNAWFLSGNAAAIGSFLGTTNTTPLQFKFNSTAAGYLDANNTSFGTSSTSTTGTNNTAIGYSATASNSATAVGASAIASQASNTAIGNSATANTSSQATAIGASSQALFQYNTAVGYNAQATISSQETVIGSSAQAQGQNNIAVGYSAKANGSDKITVVGSSAQAGFQNNTAVGYSATANTNNQATALGASANAGAQNTTALGYNASATGTNSTAIGASATTSQNNAIVLGTSTSNVGIGTSTPNTSTKLDVDGSFKMGDIGTVNKNVVSFSSALGSTALVAGTGIVNIFGGILTFSASSTDVIVTIPAAANYLSSTQASVIVSPNFDLPTSVSIASARMISTSQVKIRFVNSSTTAQTISGNLYVTINEF